MKKRVHLSILVAVLTSTLVTLFLSLHYVNQHQIEEEGQSLRNILETVAAFYPQQEPEEYVQRIAEHITRDMRVTLIDARGQVLADSEAAAAAMENHGLRPELEQAAAEGYGEDVRYSQTTGRKTIYSCRRLAAGDFLRLSTPVSVAYSYLNSVLPAAVVAILALLAGGYYYAKWLSFQMTEPYRQLAISLNRLILGEGPVGEITSRYMEMQPVIREINQIDRKLQNYITEIQEKSQEIENIISAVDDGIIVLNKDLMVLTINEKAHKMFPGGKNFAAVCRNPQLLEKLRQVLKTGEPGFLELQILSYGDRSFRCLISPAKEGAGEVCGLVVTVSDVTEIKRLEAMRSEFVSNVSHELRSPLTSIKGFGELLYNGMVQDEEKEKEYLSIIVKESTRLMNLINDILRLSEIETSSREELVTEPVDVLQQVQELLEMLSGRMKEQGIAACIQGEAQVVTQREKLWEVLLNLLDNAVKYNKPGGRITVRLTQGEQQTAISVRDTGIGIPKESLPRIFERFYRVDKARSRKSGSSGLGLAIVKHDVELLGGSIDLKSEEGQFTEITVTLPNTVQ